MYSDKNLFASLSNENISGQTVLSSFRAKLSASEMQKIMWKHEMQFRIKNDLDGLEFPDFQGLFSYLVAGSWDLKSGEKPYFKGF